MYDDLYNMCMLICDISAVYFCMLIYEFVESAIVCRNKSPTGLMLCHVSHIRLKIIFCICIRILYTPGPRDSPHRVSSGSGTRPLDFESPGPVPDP